jgi:hypothetical protein
MDESPRQLIESVQEEKMEPGRDKRVDCEHIRHGVVSVFMANEPLTGQRLVEITKIKKKKDRANIVKRIAGEMYPDAGKITFVPDNFKTHSTGSFYEAFKPIEAKGLIDRFESVFTPGYGSRLNMAEIELHAALNTQCLNRHIATVEKNETGNRSMAKTPKQ